VDGELLRLVVKDNEIIGVNGGWLPASQRIAVGIKLHPDRMTQHDWESLPGIGVHLAERIEADRQKNGEFGSLENLKRVRGVGSKSIVTWRAFF
jgi:competence protein ComEA